MPNNSVNVFLTEFEGGIFGYDVQVTTADATVGDYLTALEDFQARTLADCKGCDGCCHERAPLTLADFYYSEYYQQGGREIAAWLSEMANLQFFGAAADLTIRRTADGACHLLDAVQKCCAKHQFRTFTCRSHCCLPKSERAEALRAAIINAGEDELLRRLLAELSATGAKDFLPGETRLAGVNAADYAPNGFSHLPGERWREAKLAKLVDTALWQELQAE